MEWNTEMRRKYALGGILLYVFSTCFIVYLIFKTGIQPPAWNALFWVIVLFAAVHASSRAVGNETAGSRLYYYFLFHPLEYYFGKLLWNLLLMISLSVITYFFFSLFVRNPVQNSLAFFLVLLAAGACMAAVLTLVNFIASRASGGFALTALLAFPVLVPVLTVTVKGAKNAMDGLDSSTLVSPLLVLVLLFVAINALAALLFPFLWKE